MKKRVLAFIKEHRMLNKGERVIVGVSGGADSVCLLFLLVQLREELGIEVQAVHVHHMIRGAEADADEDFVRELCQEWKVRLWIERRDVPQIAAQQKKSLEETGREVRYQIFEDIKTAQECQKIAVAHHADDCAETMLFHLFRGTGLKGLIGIWPVQGDIIRPLLCIERAEIEYYLQQNHLSYRTDSTNLSDDYTRNRIRHQLLPVVKEQINPQAVPHMMQTAQQLKDAWEYLAWRVDQLCEQYVQQREQGVMVQIDCLIQEPKLAPYVVRYCLQQAGSSLRDLTGRHIRAVVELASNQTGKQIMLPHGWVARRTYEGLLVTRPLEEDGSQMGGQQNLEVCIDLTKQTCFEQEVLWGQRQIHITIEKKECEKKSVIPKKNYTKWFDYDRIEEVFVLRTRKPGDYLVVNEQGGKKKLKDYLIDEKVPREERNQILVLAKGSSIIWVVGHRISEAYRVTEKTRNIVEVKINGG